MSEKESNFVDTNPENQKPHNISGKNPRSVQNLHKAQVKPKSQDKEIKIEIVEDEETDYKTKTTYLVQKAKMQLKRRVAPGISEIIVRKNEEKRKIQEEQAKAEAEAKAQEEAEAEVKSKVEEEIAKQDEKIEARTEIQKEAVEEMVKADEEVEAQVEDSEPEETTEKVEEEAKSEPESEEPSSGLSFTQTLREQGLIATEKVASKVEEAKTIVEEKIEEKAETIAKEANEKRAKKEAPSTDGKSFTQSLREQGLIVSDISKEAPKTEAKVAETPKTEEKPKVEEKPVANDGEVKTFIDLIRSEGLL